MNAKPKMTDTEAIDKIKALLDRDEFAAVRRERQRINQHSLPRLNTLFAGLKLRYIETGETVVVIEIGELFETIRVKFPNWETLWCLPEELALIQEGDHQ